MITSVRRRRALAASFDTINKVRANGGSLIGPGPVVADGMLFVASGYGSHNGRPDAEDPLR